MTTIDEALAEKRICEDCIKAVLERFMQKTGLEVHDVVLGFVDFHQSDRRDPERVVSTVRLEVRL